MAAHDPTPTREPSDARVREAAVLPPRRITVLEDRAQVERKGTVALRAGLNRLAVAGVSPLLQDVSLQARVRHADGSATTGTARVLRTRRVLARDRPEEVAVLEEELDALEAKLQDQQDRHDRATQRRRRLLQMLLSAARELPEDASWGRGDASTWHHAFERLFERTREEDLAALDAAVVHGQLREEWQAVLRRRGLLHTPSAEVEAVAEIDLAVEEAGNAEVELVYVVPSALWRPRHRAELIEGAQDPSLRWTPQACIWQRTGEDWRDVEVMLSTARTGSGTEPPLLDDDALRVQRKQEQIQVEVRDVEIQRPGGGGSDGPPALPGVDDGGEARHLRVPGRVQIPSTGQATTFDLPPLTFPCEADVVAMPERAERAIRRVRFALDATEPLLPGPVTLVRGGGPFATTAVEFTAPGARQELSFGPSDDLRVQRDDAVLHDKVDPNDGWRRRTVRTRVFLSNIGRRAQTLTVVERVPVSEIDAVRIEAVAANPQASPDDDGHVHWSVALEAGERTTLELRYTLASAPDVTIEG